MMQKLPDILIFLCLTGVLSYHFYPVHFSSPAYNPEIITQADSPHQERVPDLFTSSFPAFFLAGTEKENYPETDPWSFLSVEWKSLLNNKFPKILYTNGTENFSISQSVRTIIYPFHSFF